MSNCPCHICLTASEVFHFLIVAFEAEQLFSVFTESMDSWYEDMPNGNVIPPVTTNAVVKNNSIEDQIKEDMQKNSEMVPEDLLHLVISQFYLCFQSCSSYSFYSLFFLFMCIQIIRSVEKKQRRLSASGRKRKVSLVPSMLFV